MATVVVLTTRSARGAWTRGDDGAPSAPSATRALVGALLGHEDDPGGSAATSTRDGWDDAGAPTWRDALTSARDALDALDFPRDTIVALSSTTDMPLDGRVALTHRVCAEHGARRALFVGDGDDAAWARDALTTGLDPNARFDGDGDGDGAVRVLANGDATRGNLLDAMRWLAAGARSGDSMLMHLASRVSPPPIGGKDIRATLLDALPRGAWAVLVLDEADVGIGGTTADTVGRLLRALADHTQVLCVTHAPQVAALGQHHLNVTRTADHDTAIVPLDREARVNELARMLGGQEVTAKTIEYAEELIGNG